MTAAVTDLVDTGNYPIDRPGSEAWGELVTRTKRELDSVGCSVLPDFIVGELHETLRRECSALAPQAYYTVETVNAYNIALDTPLPPDHPGRATMERGNAFVARDLIPESAIIQRLYTNQQFQHFVASCFGLPALYEMADPVAGLVVNVVTPGREHPWHFDTNEFTVSMLTQQPEAGGEFQYCPNIRTATDEHFDAVRAVLEGNGDQFVKRLTLRPGDLQLFKGRYSLHRVSEVQGDRARHTAIFAYCERPGVIGSVSRTKQLFGRVLPEHLAAESVRVDQLLD